MNLIQLGLDAGILALCCEVVFRQKAEIKAKDFFVFPILLVLCVVPRVDFSIGANMTASFRSEGFEILPADNIVGLLFLIFAVLLLSSIFFGSKSSGTVFCGTMAAFSISCSSNACARFFLLSAELRIFYSCWVAVQRHCAL